MGCRLGPSAVARFIKKAEAREKAAGVRFRNNPADSACWAETGITEAGKQITIASQFHAAKVDWSPAKKGPGSRINGAQIVIDLLQEDRFFVFDTCRHWIRTVPALQPDPDDWEDVDTEMEDHCWDETRYSLVSRHHPEPKGDDDRTPLPGTFQHLLDAEAREQKRSRLRRRAA